ncbi:Late competence development protein ComFB [Clostridium sp. C105KSO15]|nr:Late competence development protein ComFB [Clostridium sp. C105KSO15]
MARKSSKTAHVMNLLAGDDSESSKSEAAKENIAASLTSEMGGPIKELTVLAQQASIQTQDGPLTPSPISIIDMSSSAPDPVAELIKQRLEEDEENGNEVSEEDINMEAVLSPEIHTQEEIPSDQAALSEIPDSKPLDYQYLNVMEYVVKSRVKEYMEKFDTCPCDRCMADVTALSLTHLPPKYVVVEASSASPLLNYYTNRFSQQIIVELTKACAVVKENPHH